MSKMASDILGQRVSLCYSTIFYKRTNNPAHEFNQGQKPGMHGTPKPRRTKASTARRHF